MLLKGGYRAPYTDTLNAKRGTFNTNCCYTLFLRRPRFLDPRRSCFDLVPLGSLHVLSVVFSIRTAAQIPLFIHIATLLVRLH